MTQTNTRTLTTPVLPDVQVVTVVDEAQCVTTIYGGRLDREEFVVAPTVDVESHHERVCRLARMATWRNGARGDPSRAKRLARYAGRRFQLPPDPDIF